MVVSLNSSHICTQTILFCSLSAHLGSGVTSFLRRGLQAVFKMEGPRWMGVCALSAQLQGWSGHLGSLCCGGLCKKVFNICLSGYFQGSCTAPFKIFNLIWNVWGFLKLFLWFIKERKSDHKIWIERAKDQMATQSFAVFPPPPPPPSGFICKELSSQLLLSLPINLSMCITEHCKDETGR